MGITSKFSSWIGGVREHASSLHPRARVVGVLNYYHQELEEVGEQLSCFRLRNERDDDYAFRLGLHLTDALNHHEALLKRVLNYKRGQSCAS